MTKAERNTFVGVDLGGTKILAGRIEGGKVVSRLKIAVPYNGSKEEVVSALVNCIDGVMNEGVAGIGIGVPSVVDVKNGIVYDVQNIKSWDEVHLGKILEGRYQIPIQINNDANCFALGEKYFGKGKSYNDIAAVIIGTGMAAGLIINGKLYNGANCGAGEFGMIPYLDHNFEYYSSGQFFTNQHNTSGEEVYAMALEGSKKALSILSEFGMHLGNAMKALLYTIDPEVIIFGGSVSKSFPFFKDSLANTINTLAYKPVLENIKIEVSQELDIAVLGAGALLLDSTNDSLTSKLLKPTI